MPAWLEELGRYQLGGRIRTAPAHPDRGAIYVEQQTMHRLMRRDTLTNGFDQTLEALLASEYLRGMWTLEGRRYYTIWKSTGYGFTSDSGPNWVYQPFPRACHLLDDKLTKGNYLPIHNLGGGPPIKPQGVIGFEEIMKQAKLAALNDPKEPEWTGYVKNSPKRIIIRLAEAPPAVDGRKVVRFDPYGEGLRDL